MTDNLEPAGSRMEALLHRQIELQEETNRLLADIKKRMPFWPSIADFAEIAKRGIE